MRKYLIAAVAALSLVAFATVSHAQPGGDTFSLNVKFGPKNAGTKQKPKSSKLTLDVVNGNRQRTMSALDIYLPKAAKLSLKGIPKCAPDDIIAEPRACPRSAELGKGEARAAIGVNGPPNLVSNRIFDVVAFKTNSPVTGKEMLTFFLDEREGNNLKFVVETQIKKASGKYGQRLHIDVPEAAQRIGSAPNFTYNGLVSLNIKNLGKKSGNNALIGSTGCKNRKHPFKVVLTFIDNGITTADKLTKTDTTSCQP